MERRLQHAGQQAPRGFVRRSARCQRAEQQQRSLAGNLQHLNVAAGLAGAWRQRCGGWSPGNVCGKFGVHGQRIPAGGQPVGRRLALSGQRLRQEAEQLADRHFTRSTKAFATEQPRALLHHCGGRIAQRFDGAGGQRGQAILRPRQQQSPVTVDAFKVQSGVLAPRQPGQRAQGLPGDEEGLPFRCLREAPAQVQRSWHAASGRSGRSESPFSRVQRIRGMTRTARNFQGEAGRGQRFASDRFGSQQADQPRLLQLVEPRRLIRGPHTALKLLQHAARLIDGRGGQTFWREFSQCRQPAEECRFDRLGSGSLDQLEIETQQRLASSEVAEPEPRAVA
ncbi:hypothetical protein D9M69_245160 [compost metagenome]